MKHTKIIAAALAGCIAGTAVYAVENTVKLGNTGADTNKFGDINGDGKIDAADASDILRYYSYLSTVTGDAMTLEEYLVYGDSGKPQPVTVQPTVSDQQPQGGKNTLMSGGDTFTVAAWNGDDVPFLLSNWLDGDMKITANDDLKGLTTPSGAKVKFVNMGTAGSYASEEYDRLFASGEDLDVYYCEENWSRKFIDNDERTAPISALGISDSELSNMYHYTIDVGTNSDGVLKGLAFGASPGGFAYRADLADEYLGVKTPAEMQELISNWDKFIATAEKLSKEHGIALADSCGGVLNAFYDMQTVPYYSNGEFNVGTHIKDCYDYLKHLINCGGVAEYYQWTDEWRQIGAEGKTMGYFAPVWGGYVILDGASEGSEGCWAMTEGPSPYIWGGMWTLVNPKTDNGDDAASFIRSSCINAEKMKNYMKNSPTNTYLANNVSVVEELMASGEVSKELHSKAFGTSTAHIKPLDINAKTVDRKGLGSVYDDEMKIAIAGELLSGLRDGKSWEKIEKEILSSVG